MLSFQTFIWYVNNRNPIAFGHRIAYDGSTRGILYSIVRTIFVHSARFLCIYTGQPLVFEVITFDVFNETKCYKVNPDIIWSRGTHFCTQLVPPPPAAGSKCMFYMNIYVYVDIIHIISFKNSQWCIYWVTHVKMYSKHFSWSVLTLGKCWSPKKFPSVPPTESQNGPIRARFLCTKGHFGAAATAATAAADPNQSFQGRL